MRDHYTAVIGSKMIGVVFVEKDQTFTATLIEGEARYVGSFPTPTLAKRALRRAYLLSLL